MERDRLVSFLDDYLEVDRVPDYGPNGLQVIGKAEVRRVALAVSAAAEVFRHAAEADLLIVHHGLFWERDSRVVGVLLRERLRLLFTHDLTLLAYHLPLDRHPGVGNNAQIIQHLGLRLVEQERPLSNVGYVGEYAEAIPTADFVRRANQLFGAQAFVEPAGRTTVRRIGVVSGGAGNVANLVEAAARGCDLYLTGTASEPAPAVAREMAIGLVAPGHYNTEKFGVLALGALLAERFGLSTVFVDVPNPL